MIRLEELRVKAGSFSLAVDGLSVAPGEYVMVLGPTASGKTVLLETIAGLRRPHAGRVWFDGRDVTFQAVEKRKAGLVYQDYALFPHLTVAQNIAFGLSARRGARARPAAGARVRELAGLLGIDRLLGRYPEGLSGGEQQRVALARALAIEPEVLLLDEPLSALDGPTRLELQGELKRLHRGLGATVLHVTHDLDEALALGDKMAVLIEGELRQVGTPLSVTRRPADVEVARLVGLTNLLPVACVEEGGAFGDGGGQTDDCLRIQLEDGRPLEGATSRPNASGGSLFAVIPAGEIEIELLEGPLPVVQGRGSGAAGGDGVNVFEGTITSIRSHSVHSDIEVRLRPFAGETVSFLTVHVLRPHVARAGLVPGADVRLRAPASAVHLCTSGPTRDGP